MRFNVTTTREEVLATGLPVISLGERFIDNYLTCHLPFSSMLDDSNAFIYELENSNGEEYILTVGAGAFGTTGKPEQIARVYDYYNERMREIHEGMLTYKPRAWETATEDCIRDFVDALTLATFAEYQSETYDHRWK